MQDILEQFIRGYNYHTQNLIVILVAIVLGVMLRYLLYFLLRLYNWGTNHLLARSLRQHTKGTMLFLLPIFFILLLMPLIHMRWSVRILFERSVQVAFIVTFAWLVISLLYVVQDLLFYYYDITREDNHRAKKVRTQILFIRRLLIMAVIIIAIALIFSRFEGMRKVGLGILTSAGVLGIILGFAAQRTLANFLAGLQIAFTQPIRIDDVVVVEGEWGRIEEITLTYVVVHLWDNRRLVLPITYFIEKPFQNLTRLTSDLMGGVHVHSDYTLPVGEVRTYLETFIKDEPLWDGNICRLQVTNSTDKTMEIRALVSARNSNDLFDLRAIVRERLVGFIQGNYPNSLPHIRSATVNDEAEEEQQGDKKA